MAKVEVEPLGLAPKPLSANIYCSGCLEYVLQSVVQPLKLLAQQKNGPDCLLWFSRYGRCGEHIKIRLHVQEVEWTSYRDEITRFADRSFANLPLEPDRQPARISAPALPPIDPEDESDVDYPDRSILWTSFRPSPVIVGNQKYIEDAKFLARFHACMAASSDQILEWLSEDGQERATRERQMKLIKVVLEGILGLPLTPADRIMYFAYHRGWLLRFILSNASAVTTEEATLQRLDRQLESMRNVVERLSSTIRKESNRSAVSAEPPAFLWAFYSFFSHVVTFRGQREFDLDPYTTDAAFLPMFKVLHGVANQVGVSILHELYVYHLLLRSSEMALDR